MTADPRIDGYDWAGGREAMLRFGPDSGPVVVAALPLFEEANRTRAFIVAILRALAVRGIGSVLPDVPGQGESVVALETVSLADMRTALAAAVTQLGQEGRPTYAIAIRSGTLLTNLVLPPRRERGGRSLDGSWQLAPQDGPSLLRELSRMKQAESRAGQWGEVASQTLIAGNLLSPAMLAALATGDPTDEADIPRRVLRLSTDPAPADRKLDGPPLWRRSEPGTDEALSQILADDIADWIAACEG